MLLREDGEAAVAIGQASHAWLSGQLARAWGNDAFPAPAPFEEVCLGAEQHDVGMAAWDLAPELNPETGRPRQFYEVPRPTHVALWAAAPERMLTQSRYAALLVSLHGSRLYKDLDRSAFERGVRATLDASDDEIERNSRLIATWDGMSLALLLGWRPWEDDGILMHEDGRVEPWPFAASSVTVRTEGRLLRETNAPLEEAPWVQLAYELRQ